LHFGGDGGLRGIDPRDAAIEFNDGKRPRVLPTNTVCIYAPRFAEVRVSVGLNESLIVQSLKNANAIEREISMEGRAGPKRMTQNQGAEAALLRLRASGLIGRVYAGEQTELRVLSGYENSVHVARRILSQGLDRIRIRQKVGNLNERARPIAIKTGE